MQEDVFCDIDEEVQLEAQSSKRSRREASSDEEFSPAQPDDSSLGNVSEAGWIQHSHWREIPLPKAIADLEFPSLCDKFGGRNFIETKALDYLAEIDVTSPQVLFPKFKMNEDGSLEVSCGIQSKRVSARKYWPVLIFAANGDIAGWKCTCVVGSIRCAHAGALLVGLWREAKSDNEAFYAANFGRVRSQPGRRTADDAIAAVIIPDPSASYEKALSRFNAQRAKDQRDASQLPAIVDVALFPEADSRTLPPPAHAAPQRPPDDKEYEAKYDNSRED